MKRKILKHTLLPLLIASALSSFSASALAVGELIEIEDSLRRGSNVVKAINDDGTVAVGGGWVFGGSIAWRYTTLTGMQRLETGGVGVTDSSNARDINGKGDIVVGEAYTLNEAGTGSKEIAFRWTAGTGMVDIGSLIPGGEASANGVSSDGTKIVGDAQYGENYDRHAFLWHNDVMTDLGSLYGDGVSVANAISSDGNVIVGSSASNVLLEGIGTPINHAFKYDSENGMVDLGVLSIDGVQSESWANAVSADGGVIVGASSALLYGRNSHAVMWDSDGIHDIHSAAAETSNAHGINGDGSVIVGSMTIEPGLSAREHAFRWTAETGMQSVEAWLADNDVIVGEAVATQSARDVSKDGTVVVGVLSNDQAFIARVGSEGSGLMTVEKMNDSLISSVSALGVTMASASTVINGAHSRPMSRRVNKGEKTLWLAGDWGRDNHNSRDVSVGMAEVGGGYNFGSVQLNLSLGKTWANQDTYLGGRSDSSGKYFMFEGIVPLSVENGLYATLGGYGHWGEVDIRRGYTNAGTTAYSKASPDSDSWGVRARVDWLDSVALASVKLSPYADLSYTHSSMDSFTETGGGFPAQFDKREEGVTELRLGLNAALPLESAPVIFVANLEAAHRFDSEGARTSGQMVGLFAFDLEGQQYDSTWMKAGVGLEADLELGKASIMLNATTEGEMPTAWLAASYQVKF